MWRRYQVWVDANGFTRLTLVNTVPASLVTPDPAAPVVAALAAKSNAAPLNDTEGTLNVVGSPAPTAGIFQVVSDCAALMFQDAAGNKTRLQLVAPQSGIFMADQETVDPTQIAAIIAAVVGTVMTAAGGVVTAYVGGTRQPTTKENY